MLQMVETVLKTYGTAVTLQQGEALHTVRAFFQPVRSKSWQYLEGNYSPLGEIPRGQYVYLGPVSPKAEAGDTLLVDGKAYWLRRTELVRDGKGPVYCWGMCVEKGGEDTWGQS
ncbi:MAG: hypothetical protein IKT52_11835 [Oscillospiraceae bacterium]|nr:hypothetical protein [Oscillospiraceae bacterium]